MHKHYFFSITLFATLCSPYLYSANYFQSAVAKINKYAHRLGEQSASAALARNTAERLQATNVLAQYANLRITDILSLSDETKNSIKAANNILSKPEYTPNQLAAITSSTVAITQLAASTTIASPLYLAGLYYYRRGIPEILSTVERLQWSGIFPVGSYTEVIREMPTPKQITSQNTGIKLFLSGIALNTAAFMYLRTR